MGQLITPSRQLIVGPRGFRKPARPVLDPNHPISRGLMHYWHLEGSSGIGGSVKDYGSFPSAGTPAQNAGNHQVAGHHGGTSHLFDSTGSESIAWSGNFPEIGGLAAFTLSVWYYPISQGADYTGFLAKQSSATNETTASIGGAGLADGTAAAFLIRNGSDAYGYTASGACPNGAWVFLTFVFDGAQSGNSNRCKIYKNGVSQSLTFNGTIPSTLTTNSVVPKTGSLTNGANSGFKGRIDAMRIYKRALSASEVAQLYAEPYAGIVEQAPRWRVGSAAAATFNPGWATGATKTIGGVF